MKTSRELRLRAGWLGAAGLVAAAGAVGAAACGNSSGGSSASEGGPDTSVGCVECYRCGPSGKSLPPPPPPSGAYSTQVTKSHNYALHDLFLGDTDRTGVASADAWKAIGYNLDDLCTDATSTDVCTPLAGASRQVQVDGEQGIDNSFGENVMPLLAMLDSTLSQGVNRAIQGGDFTLFMYVTGFDDSAGNTTTALGLTGELLSGAKYAADGGMPGWGLSTSWPVLPDPGLVSGCAPYPAGCPAVTDPIRNAVIKFPSAFQTKGTFVNGTPSPLTFSLAIAGHTFDLSLASALITFDPLAPGAVTNGTVAGVIDTGQLISALRPVAGSLSASLCAGSAFQSLVTGIEQSQDILLTGTTVSNAAGSTCNGISLGLGFDATEIAPPTTIAAPTPPGAPTCDAGVDAEAGAVDAASDAPGGDAAVDASVDAIGGQD